jgi:adenine-specific DNA-methyltransferase
MQQATSTAMRRRPGNLLVQGDNLDALKALLPFHRGRVKCIFIDPPYNTRSAFEHYDDNLEHSQWLSMMLPRLQLLREFLREDGSIWVTIDDNEGHYLKVLMDEVFGRGTSLQRWLGKKSIAVANDHSDFNLAHATIMSSSSTADSGSMAEQFACLERKSRIGSSATRDA